MIYRDTFFTSRKRIINAKHLEKLAREIRVAFWRRKLEKKLSEAEERYHSVIENSRDAIFVTTPGARYLDVNPAACSLLGYERAELLQMETPDLYSNPDSFTRLKETGAFFGEMPLKTKGGKTIICEINSNILPDGNYLGIVRDITERKKMEENILKNQKLDSIGILAGGIAHDFNNYLTGILSTIELMELFYTKGKDLTKYFTSLKESVDKAGCLTRQLLTFSKGGSPVKELVSLSTLIKDIVELTLRGSNLELKLTIPNDLWSAKVDRGQISQVITNLVINACQAMPDGGIINVAAENFPVDTGLSLPLKPGKYVKITVSDQGIGIPEINLTRIFDPFFTTKPGGSGLGLAISYSIMKQHEGLIQVESKVGIGTVFYLYIPAYTETRSPKKLTNAQPLEGAGKILIMDDDTTIRETIGELLTDSGYEVAIAQEGLEAVEIYKKAKNSHTPFDIVIIDLTIPGGMGGYELITKLKTIDPKVKAVVSSGYSNHPIISNFKKYGFSGVVAKPYKIDDLIKVLQRVIIESDAFEEW